MSKYVIYFVDKLICMAIRYTFNYTPNMSVPVVKSECKSPLDNTYVWLPSSGIVLFAENTNIGPPMRLHSNIFVHGCGKYTINRVYLKLSELQGSGLWDDVTDTLIELPVAWLPNERKQPCKAMKIDTQETHSKMWNNWTQQVQNSQKVLKKVCISLHIPGFKINSVFL